MGWMVELEVAGKGKAPEADDLFAFGEVLDEVGGFDAAVTGSPETPSDGKSRYGAALSLDVTNARDAVSTALDGFTTAAAKAGFPDWPIASLVVKPDEELERELSEPNFPELLGVSELGDLLGVSRQRAWAISQRADFPVPVAVLSSGPVWALPNVRHFVNTWPRRAGRPRTSPSVGTRAASVTHGAASGTRATGTKVVRANKTSRSIKSSAAKTRRVRGGSLAKKARGSAKQASRRKAR